MKDERPKEWALWSSDYDKDESRGADERPINLSTRREEKSGRRAKQLNRCRQQANQMKRQILNALIGKKGAGRYKAGVGSARQSDECVRLTAIRRCFNGSRQVGRDASDLPTVITRLPRTTPNVTLFGSPEVRSRSDRPPSSIVVPKIL
jgi:hypothetical protein